MDTHLTAKDLWPIIQKMPPAERLRLIAMATALDSAEAPSDAARYEAAPPRKGEFDDDDSGLGWDADGWGGFDAAR